MADGRYVVEFSPAAVRALKRLDRAAQRRIQAVVELLAENPRPPGACALRGRPPGTLRVRTGEYRVVYEVHDARLVVLVIRLGHRREVCRR